MKTKKELKEKILEINLTLVKYKDNSFAKDILLIELNRLTKEYKKLLEEDERTKRDEI